MQNVIAPHRVGIALVLGWLGLALAASAQDTEPVGLSPNWTAGQWAEYELWSTRQREESITVQGDTQEFRTSRVTEGRLRWEVARVRDDGSSEVTLTIQELVITLTNRNGETRTFGGDDGADGPMAVMLDAITDRPFTVNVSSDGTPTSVDGTDAIREAADNPRAVPDDDVFLSLAHELAALPSSPEEAEPGTQWTSQILLPGDRLLGQFAFDYDTTTRYRITSQDRLQGVPVVEVTSSSEAEAIADRSRLPAEAPPLEADLDLEDSQSTIYFDTHRREIAASHTSGRSTLSGTLTLPNGVTVVGVVHSTYTGQVLRVATDDEE